MQDTHIQKTSGSAPSRDRGWIARGIEAFEQHRYPQAEACLAQAVANEPGRSEPWYWLGRIKEQSGDPKSAAYCYYLALTAGRHHPSLDSLERLGYLSLDLGALAPFR